MFGKPRNDPPGRLRQYARYSGMAMQIIGALLIGYFLGNWLDRKFSTEKPYFTAICVLIMLFGYFYAIILDTRRPRK